NNSTYLLEELNRLRSYLQVVWETLPWIAIVVIQQRDANGIRAVVFEQVTDKRQVAQRFAHLLAFLVYHACMHPDARKRRYLREMFGLGDFAGVMREGKVKDTTVNI